MVKARYITVRREDKKNERINLNDIEVFDNNGYRLKGYKIKVYPPDKDLDKAIIITKESPDAYIEIDLGEDKPLGRVIVRNRSDCCDGRIIGCALIIRKDNNNTVFYRKFIGVHPEYNFPIGKAKPIQQPKEEEKPKKEEEKKPATPAIAPAIPAPAPVPAQPVWKNITGKLKQVSVDPDWVWGVNADDNIFKCRAPCEDGKWTQVDSKLSQLDVGGTDVWGVNYKQEIFRRPKDGSGKWTQVKGKLKQISVGPTGKVWGVNSKDEVFMCKSVLGVPCNNEWQQIKGSLRQIDVGPNEVWGVDKKNDVYTRPNDGSGNWKKVDGSFKQVSVGREQVVGVSLKDEILVCRQPCTGKWETPVVKTETNIKQAGSGQLGGAGAPAPAAPVVGKAKQIDTSDDVIMGVNTNNEVFLRTMEVPTLPKTNASNLLPAASCVPPQMTSCAYVCTP